ncbi:MAG: hypothetical protein RLN72_15410 [Henriciella sp.]
MTKSRVCFVVSPIGEDKSETRKNADLVLKHIITEPAENAGYKVVRADQIEQSGNITNQVIEHVLESELVIADLTGHNPNVFYELALRHAIRKPFVQLISKDEDLPFDVSPQRTIHYDLDLEGAERARQELSKFLEKYEEDTAVDSPVSMAVDLYGKGSKSSESQQLISLRNEVGQLLSEVQNLPRSRDEAIVERLESISKTIDANHAREYSGSTQIVEAFSGLSNLKLNGYPKEVIVARIADLLRRDYPKVALQILDSLDGFEVNCVPLFSIKDQISEVRTDLIVKGLAKDSRLARILLAAEVGLNELLDDEIPF